MTTHPSTPDLDEVRHFLTWLDEEVEDFCFQTFDDNSVRKDRRLARTLHGPLDELWPELVRLNRAGAGVFVAVNEIAASMPRTKANVLRIRAAFEDQDQADTPEPDYPIEPHCIVESSSGKRHAYFLVDGLPLEQFGPVQKTIADFCCSDTSVSDTSRVMRLPGFHHMKNPDNPFMVRILRMERTQPYSAEQILAAFPPVPVQYSSPAPSGMAEPNQPANDEASRMARKIAFDAARRTRDDPHVSRHFEIVCMGHFLRRDDGRLTKRIGELMLQEFELHMRPTDAAGNVCGMDWESAARALRDAFNKPSEADRPKRTPIILGNPQSPEEWPIPGPVGGVHRMPDYPAEALPTIVEDALAEYWVYAKQPLALLGTSCLGVLSQAAQAHSDVARDSVLRSPTSLFTLIFGDSGERKSAADKAFGKPLRDWEAEEGKAREAEIRANRGRRASWRAQLDGVKAKIKSAAGKEGDESKAEVRRLEEELERLEQDEPPLVPKPRMLFEEVTQHGLTYDLATGFPTAGIFSDEGGIVLGSAAMGEDSSTGFQGVLNRLWDGSPYKETRKSVEAAEIIGRRFTLSIMVQWMLLEQLVVRGARGIGLLARCLIAAPESTMGKRLYSAPPDGMPKLARFHARLRELLDIPLPLNDKGQLEPPVMPLDAQAQKLWIRHHDQIERDLGEFGEYAAVRDFGSKSAENAARIACLFQIFSDGPGGRVGADAMQRGITLAQWYLESARGLFFDVSKPQEVRDAEQLSTWLMTVAPALTDKGGRLMMQDGIVPTRVILNRGPNSVRDKGRRDAALMVLADPEVGHVRSHKEGRKLLIEVNPLLLSQGISDAA